MKKTYRILGVGLLIFELAWRAFGQTTNDPYLWLEDVSSPRATAWVRTENEKTLAVLEKDPRYETYFSNALAIAESKDRIPEPSIIGGQIYNFWQDADHVHGVWRRTTKESYQSASPNWTTVLDLDQLSKDEQANWFWKGEQMQEPNQKRCMISLSEGGEDAVTVREFDLETGFVKDGFNLSRAKQRVAWADENSLLVARAKDESELTVSGYPYVVQRLGREKDGPRVVVFRGDAHDGGYGVDATVFHDSSGNQATIITRPLTTFQFEEYLMVDWRPVRLGLPLKSDIHGLVGGKLIVSLAEDWVATGQKAGSLVAIDLAEAKRNPEQLKPVLIYAPGPRESLERAAFTQNGLIVTTFTNVRSRAFVYQPDGNTWQAHRLGLPDNATIQLAASDIHSSDAYLEATGYLQPPSLWHLQADTQALQQMKTLPSKFDASHDVVEQFEATSSDGTKIPYFIVHPVNMKLDGNNPTILYAYGGFQVSLTPSYSANIGKLWLERGGVFVQANIRGGGEFGPAWHEAGLKTHRQIIYDDFAAVARDLIARKITQSRRLGIQGGSNGGLLMGVEFTEHPELWEAVDIQVPLLDMERFEQIAAGTSWVGEYGSMTNAAERKFLSSISPYANLHRGVKYPQPLLWTTTKDDRVGPQHARKFAARMEEYGIPYYFYEVTEGGHASGANLKERARTTAMEMIYFTRKLVD